MDDYDKVPSDFPRGQGGAVAGVHDKVLMTTYQGKLYPAGETPPEIWARWDASEDLAKQLAQKSLESKAGKRAHMTEAAILEQYLTRLRDTGWRSEAETRWVIRRVAEMLNWPMPAEANSIPKVSY